MIWKWVIAGLVAREAVVNLQEVQERRQVYRQARQYCDTVCKPLLVVGTPRWGFNHPCGDITIDNFSMPGVRHWNFCDVVEADVRDIPYTDGYFGAAYCSHVLEHLPTIEDAMLALNEMERVANKVFIVSPHKSSLLAWIYPGHHLWVNSTGDGYIIEQRGHGKIEPEYRISMVVI